MNAKDIEARRAASWRKHDARANSIVAEASRRRDAAAAERGPSREELLAAIASVVRVGRLGLDDFDMDQLQSLLARAGDA